MIDRIIIDVFSPRLESDYLRFDESVWYFHDKRNDCYIRIYDCETLESLYRKEKENAK